MAANFETLLRAAGEEASKREKGEDDLSLALFPYEVPESKQDEKHEEMIKERISVLEGLCKQSLAIFKRPPSAWNGDKLMEEKDVDWAGKKQNLLKEEKKTLIDGKILTAKRLNLNLKLHEKKRPAPSKLKRKFEKGTATGESPDLKKKTCAKENKPNPKNNIKPTKAGAIKQPALVKT